MNSNQLRIAAMAVYFVIGVLVALNVLTEKQGFEILAAAVGAKEFGQQYLTPATNQRTPDVVPPKAP